MEASNSKTEEYYKWRFGWDCFLAGMLTTASWYVLVLWLASYVVPISLLVWCVVVSISFLGWTLITYREYKDNLRELEEDDGESYADIAVSHTWQSEVRECWKNFRQHNSVSLICRVVGMWLGVGASDGPRV